MLRRKTRKQKKLVELIKTVVANVPNRKNYDDMLSEINEGQQEFEELYREHASASQKLKKKTNPLFITILLLLALVSLLLYLLLKEASNDWQLAAYSFALTVLYIHMYRTLENGEYIRGAKGMPYNKEKLQKFIQLTRWVFFVIFLLCQSIIFTEYGLWGIESGPKILLPTWLALIAAMGLGLPILPRSIRLERSIKNRFAKEVISFLSWMVGFYLLLFCIALFFAIGVILHKNQFINDLAVGVVVALTLTASINFYFTEIKKWFIKP